MNARSSRLFCGGSIDLVHQRHIERAAKRQPLREYRSCREHRSMSSFFVFEERNFQARLGKRDPLKLIQIVHRRCQILQSERIEQGKEASAWADLRRMRSRRKFSYRLDLFGSCFSQLVHVGTWKIELSDLLFQ